MGRNHYLQKGVGLSELPKKESEDLSLWEKSAGMAAMPWQSNKRFQNLFTSYVKMLKERLPEIPTVHLAQYVHDLVAYDQGKNLGTFFNEALELKKIYGTKELPVALRILAKSYWIKDEVFVSHQMISPVKRALDFERYKELGSSFEVVHINRPSFDIFGQKIEFDFSPKIWMLKAMKNMRVLRILMPEWHKKERKISIEVRKEILSSALPYKRLMELDNIKGYREVRYKFAEKFLGRDYV